MCYLQSRSDNWKHNPIVTEDKTVVVLQSQPLSIYSLTHSPSVISTFMLSITHVVGRVLTTLSISLVINSTACWGSLCSAAAILMILKISSFDLGWSPTSLQMIIGVDYTRCSPIKRLLMCYLQDLTWCLPAPFALCWSWAWMDRTYRHACRAIEWTSWPWEGRE